MSAADHIAVVGASLAGLRAAEQLRASGHEGPITVFGEEPHLPYNRPPLSKQALTEELDLSAAQAAAKLAFRRRASVEDVEFRLGDAVVAADLSARELTTAAGTRVNYDGLVVATGLRPRRLNLPGPSAGVHALRTVEDCLALREDLKQFESARVVVIGAGFIGCEVAGSLLKQGHRVTVVEPAGPPMVRVLGERLAQAVQAHHEAAGIRFLINRGVSALAGGHRATGVEVSGGERLEADVVVESVGCVCNTEWLDGNGLDLSNGVLTDNALRAAERVVAVGDIARFPNPLFDGVARRVEHWSMPTDTAKRAARTLVAELRGEPVPAAVFAPVPSFWSDQLDLRFQSKGSPGLADEAVVVEGELDELTAGLLVSYRRGGQPVGTVAVNLSPARQRELNDEFMSVAAVA